MSGMERVLVVRRDRFFGGQWPQGFLGITGQDARRLLAQLTREGHFVERAEAEQTPARKQLIPYCVVTCGSSVLCVQRHRRQSESRLHGLWSIGIGGHIDEQDAGADPIRAGLRRELAEELSFPEPVLAMAEPQFLGLLNDDGTEVGSVHVGLVFQLEVEDGQVTIREQEKMSGGFRNLSPQAAAGRVVGPLDLWQDPKCFETWSRILLEAVPWLGAGASQDSNKITRGS
jgi:predicted NUDIX family phosphoesterase